MCVTRTVRQGAGQVTCTQTQVCEHSPPHSDLCVCFCDLCICFRDLSLLLHVSPVELDGLSTSMQFVSMSGNVVSGGSCNFNGIEPTQGNAQGIIGLAYHQLADNPYGYSAPVTPRSAACVCSADCAWASVPLISTEPS